MDKPSTIFEDLYKPFDPFGQSIHQQNTVPEWSFPSMAAAYFGEHGPYKDPNDSIVPGPWLVWGDSTTRHT